MRNQFSPDLAVVVQQEFPETVPGVIERMGEIQKALGDPARPLAAFNFLYKDITATILRVLQNSLSPIQGFDGLLPDLNPLANLLHRSVERFAHAEPSESPAGNMADLTGFSMQSAAAVSVEGGPGLNGNGPDDTGLDPKAGFAENFSNLRGRLEQAFLDPAAMDALDVEFARMYFRSLKAWSLDEEVAQCWGVLFEKWDDAAGEGPFTGALLGINAHINHDLAIAVRRTHDSLDASITNGSDRHGDYLTINDVFLIQTPLLYERLKGVLVGPKFIFWELMGAGPIEETSQFLIRETRDVAWNHAQRIERGEVPEPTGTVALIDATSDAVAGAIADGILAAFF